VVIDERMGNLFGHLKNRLGEFIAIFKELWPVEFQAVYLLMNIRNLVVDNL
jgi:hypothetical protein